jgi:diaminopimelate decarboxylase
VPLHPVTYRVNDGGHAEVGGCDLLDLARAHGTPLYVYDEEDVRLRCREYVAAMGDRGDVLYSAKAFASPAFLRVVASEGLGLDVVSAGELEIALRAGYPTDRIHFLGNNKSLEDVEAAWREHATLVIDGSHEFELLERVIPPGRRMSCQIRLSPGVRPDTHELISTGQLDTKFGFAVEAGTARAAVERALANDRVELVGLHSHIGSQIVDLGAYSVAMDVVLDLVAELRHDFGYQPARLSAGGGLGIPYTTEDDPPTPRELVQSLLGWLDAGAAKRGLSVPRLEVEPGRSIAGPAGIALYTVGSIKEVPGVRCYVAVDGGMGDNIRPKLYGARYQPFLAANPEGAPKGVVTVAGKYCESTDVLAADVPLPAVHTGDVLGVPAAGAYCLSMSSNYNGMTRPAVVMVRDGRATLIRRRETLDDLLAAEIF